jgi:hypothetical protein
MQEPAVLLTVGVVVIVVVVVEEVRSVLLRQPQVGGRARQRTTSWRPSPAPAWARTIAHLHNPFIAALLIPIVASC